MESTKITQVVELLAKARMDNTDKKKLRKELQTAIEDLSVGLDESEFRDVAKQLVNALNAELAGIGKSINLDDILGMKQPEAFKKLGQIAANDFMDAFSKEFKGFGGDQLNEIVEILRDFQNKLGKDGIKVFNEKNLEEVEKQIAAISAAVDKIAAKSANNLVKSVDEINAAVGRSKGSFDEIEDALKPQEDVKKKDVRASYEGYVKSVKGKSHWEEQYKWLVKFIGAYEAYTSKTKKPSLEDGWQDLYNKRVGGNATRKNMLQDILNLRDGKPIDRDSEPWARETTLIEVRDVLQAIAQNGLTISSEGESDNKPAKQKKNKKEETSNNAKRYLEHVITELESEAAAKNEKISSDSLKKRVTFKSRDNDWAFGSIFDSFRAGASTISEFAEDLLQMLSAIDGVDVKALKNGAVPIPKTEVEHGGTATVAIDKESLKSVLQGITYNVHVESKPEELERILNEYKNLNAKQDLTDDENERLGELYDKIGNGLADNDKNTIYDELDKWNDGKGKSVDELVGLIVSKLPNQVQAGSDSADDSNISGALKELVTELKLDSSNDNKIIDLISALRNESANEQGTFLNSTTGKFLEITTGLHDSVEYSTAQLRDAAKEYDTRVHSHNSSIAAPSVLDDDNKGSDFDSWIKSFDSIKKQMIVAKNEILSFDFSSITKDQLVELRDKYKVEAEQIRAEFKNYKVQDFGGYQGWFDAYQVKLRQAFDKIIEPFSGVMTSYHMPNAVSSALQENGSGAATVTIDIESLKQALEEVVKKLNGMLQTEGDSNAKPVTIGDTLNVVSPAENNQIAQETTLKEIKGILEKSSDDNLNDEVKTEEPSEPDNGEKIRTAILQELAKYGTLNDALKAGGKRIQFDGSEVHFGSFVSDYLDTYLGQSFDRDIYGTMWKEAREQFHVFTPVELTKEDAIDIIREKMPDNILEGWFRKGDSAYKKKLEEVTMSDDELRNAALNIMWSNFKEFSGKDIGFKDFLNSEIPVYRGKNSEKYVDGDELLAFSFDENMAKRFGNHILETLIKPIDTLGAFQTTAEAETLVYRKQLEDKSEYQQWHAAMAGVTSVKPEQTTEVIEKAKQIIATQQDWINRLNSVLDDNNFKTSGKKEAADQLRDASKKLIAYRQTPELYSHEAYAEEKRIIAWNKAYKEAEKQGVADSILTQNYSSDAVNSYEDALNFLQETKDMHVRILNSETEVLNKLQQEHRDTIDVIEDETLAKKELNAIPSEEDIKSGKASWRGMPIAYDANQSAEGSNWTDFMKLGPKFFDLDDNGKRNVLDHEVAHTIADQIMKAAVNEWQAVTDIFAPEKESRVDGEIKKYREGLYGDLGATALSETVTHALSEYFNNPNDLKQRSVEAYNYIENYVSGTGSNLDNVGAQTPSASTTAIVPSDVKEDEETKDMNTLLDSVNAVTEAVKLKTRAFWTEKTAVDQVVEGEVAALKELEQKVLDIKNILGPMFDDTKLDVIKKAIEAADIIDKQSEKETKKQDEKDSGDKRSDQLKKQQKLYESLGKAQANYEASASAVNQASLDNIKETIAEQEERLKITKEEREELERYATSAHKAQEALLGGKATDKDFKQKVKESKENARMSSAGSTINSAANVLDGAYLIADDVSSENADKIKELNSLLDQLKQKYREIRSSDGVVSDEDASELQIQIRNVKNLSQEVKELVNQYDRFDAENVINLGGFHASLGDWQKQLTNAVMAATNGKAKITGFNHETQELNYTLNNGKYEFTEYAATIDHTRGRMVAIAGVTKRTETLFEQLGRKAKEIFAYFGGSSLIYDAFNQVRQGIQYVRDIDGALTELKKVTDETEESYDRFLDTAAKTANKVGSTIKNIVSSTADWAKLGFNMEDAAQLAESTSVLLNVSEFASIDEATSALISTMQAFGYTADESMHVVDVMNIIGNRFAVSTDGLAVALQDSASALMNANNSYQEAAAMVAAANKVVQNPSEVGSALRTISLRLRGTSVKELEEMGEDTSGAVTTKSKLRSKLKGLTGVDILTDTGAYKSTYEILLEISKVWDKLTDENRAGALELISGKNRANVASALLTNTKDLEEAYTTAMEAEGSALKENETYLDSIQGRIDLFTNALQNFWNNLLDDEAIKWIVSLGTEVLKLASTFGELRTVLFLTFTYLNLSKKTDFLSWTVNSILKLSSALSGLGREAKEAKKIVDDVNESTTTIGSTPIAKSEQKSTKQKLLGAGTDETKSANRFSEIWKHHIQRVKDSLNRVKQDFTTIWQHHNERVEHSVQYASGQLNKLKESASNAFGAMSSKISNVANNVKNVFSGIFSRTKIATNDTTGKSQEVASYTKEANRFSQIWQNHITRLRDSFNRVKQDISNIWQHHSDRVAWSVEYTGKQFDKLKNAVTQRAKAMADSIGNIVNNIRNAFGNISLKRTKVAPVEDNKTEDVAQTKPTTKGFTATIKKMQAEFNRIWKSHLVRVNDSVNGMKNAFTTLWQHHAARVSESMSYAGGLFSKFKNAVVTKVGEIKKSIATDDVVVGLKMTFSSIFGWFDKLASKSKQTMGKVKSTIVDAFDILKQSLNLNNVGGKKKNALDVESVDISSIFSKAARNNEKLEIDDSALFAKEIDLISQKDNADIVEYIKNVNELGDTAGKTKQAVAAYASSVQDGNYSVQAGTAFVDAHNAKLKASGAAAKLAAVGHGILNAALSMGLSVVLQFAMEGLTKLIKYLGDAANPTEALADEISDLGSKISDTESEIDTINSDLEKCKERMAELLAMPSLSLVEQEELDNLKSEIALLERKLQLQEMLLESQTAAELSKKTEYIDEAWNNEGKYNIKGWSGVIREDTGLSGFFDNSKSTTEIIEEAMEIYQDREKAIAEAENILLNWDSASLSEKNSALLNMDTNEGGLIWSFLWNDKDKYNDLIEEAKSMNQEVATSIEEVFSDENYSGLSYGLNDTVDEFLDEFYAYQYKWNDMLGMDSKSEAIGSIFDDTSSDVIQKLKTEIEEISNSEDELGDKQKQIANKVNAAVNSQNDAYRRLTTTMKIAGVTAEEIAEYFTLGGGLSDFDALDVKIEEVARASKTFEDLLKGQEFKIDGVNIGLADLFDEEGRIVQTKLSQIFNNTSAQTRKDITSILEGAYDGIKDGTVNIENLMTKFAFKTGQQIIDIQKSLLTTVNQELFPNLEGEISGIIDTFNELATAVGNVVDAMDLLDQARAEETYSGSISLETLQNLMAYTDDYAKLVSIDETGAIHLAANAQEILIQEKLNAIKANAQLAYEEANKAYQEALAAETSVSAANTLKNVLTPAIDQVSGGLAFLGSLWGSVKAAFAGGLDGIFDFSISDAISQAQSAYSSTISSRQYNRETEAATTLAEAKEALERAEANLKIANNLTADNVKTRYSSEEASGGTSNAKEAADKKAEDAEKAAQEKFDKLRKEYEFKISQKENEQKYLENEIARMEANDEQVGKAIYERQIELENEKIKLLEEERTKLLTQMQDVPKYSDLWHDYASAVWETEHAIQESTIALAEHKQSIADLYIDAFNKIADAYDKQQELYGYQANEIETTIELKEIRGEHVYASDYDALRGIKENERASALEEAESLRQALELGYNDEGKPLSDEEIIDMTYRMYDAEQQARDLAVEIENINEKTKQLYVTAFDKVTEAFDAISNLYDDRAAYTEGYIEIQELKGEPVSTDAYDYLIENTQNAIANAEGKLAEQQIKLQNAIANGIKVGSEDWIKMTEDIRATEAELQGHHKTLIQYTEDLKQLYYTAFEKVRDSFGDVTDVYDDQQAFIESYIDYLETIGVAVPEELYDELISVEEQKQQANVQKLADLQDSLAKMEAEGFGPEDEEWVTAQADIRATEKAIWDSEVAMAEFNKRMRELETEKFEEFVKRIGDLVNELDRVYDLLSDEDVATEDGAWTEEGITSLGLMYQKMEIAKKQIADYQDEIDKLNDQYKSGAISEQEYNDRLVDLKNNQWDSVEALESAKDAIIDLNEARIDMIEEGIQKEIDAFEELIQLKKDELDAERDLYEFKKNIKNQTDDISSLERRIASMSGSTDAATVAERTKLEAELRKKREDLDDTYYTHAMDSQSSALDDENEDYVTSKEDYIEKLRESLEDVESIVANTMSQVLINANTVLGGLNGVSAEYGITLSDYLTSPWISAAEQAEAFKNSALAGEYEFAIQNGIFTGEITGQLADMFGQGTSMAYQFSSDVYTVIDTIKYTVNEAAPFVRDDLVIPFSDALNYVQNTFSPYTLAKLQEVANKADSLVYSETEDLTAPWNSGTEAVNTYGTTAEDILKGVVADAITYDPSDELTFPLDAAGDAWDMFGQKVSRILSGLVTKANSDAAKIGTAMDNIVADAKAAADAIAKTGTTGGGEKPKTNPTPTPAPAPDPAPEKKITGYRCMATVTVNGKEYQATAVNKTPASAKTTATQYLYEQLMKKYKDRDGNTDMAGSMWEKSWSKKVKHGACVPVYYAKGTLGTKKDEWAITDEPQYGDELVLVPGANGNLSFMRKGTSVVPADITENLMEWGQLSPNTDMSSAVQGINIMTNYVNKPEVKLEFENLLHIDNCSQDSIKDVEKIVTEQLDKFTRKLNTNLRQFK